MKKRIILLLAALTALLSCSDSAFEYDNPLDRRGTNYGYKLTIPTVDGGTVDATRDGVVSETGTTRTYAPFKDVKVTATAGSGYEFTGWSGALTSKDAIVTITMDGNKTLTPNFQRLSVTQPTTFTIAFNDNGAASGTAPPAVTVNAGSEITLPNEGSLTRSGYDFSGWNTSADGTGTTYTAGSPYTVNDNATLYAKWKDNYIPPQPTYTLIIAANPSAGGTVNPSVGTHTYDEGESVTVTATANGGYTFTNWSGESSSTNATIYVTMNGHKTLTANFQKNDTPPSGNTFTDARDGKNYKKVTIGTQTWMAENLNYEATGSKCGNESAGRLTENSEDCNKYGRLYNWSTAMGGSSSSSASPSGVRGVCPVGWHVPSDAEWTTLTDYVGGASTAGTKLKSPQYWNSYSGVPEGTDEFGFGALPGGYGSSGGSFYDAGDYGYWWSATEGSANYAWYRDMDYFSENVYRYYYGKTYLFSVRCAQD